MSQMHTLESKRARKLARQWRRAHPAPPPGTLPPDPRTGRFAPVPGASSPTHLEAYAWRGARRNEPWARVFSVLGRAPAGPARRVKVKSPPPRRQGSLPGYLKYAMMRHGS